MRNPINSNSIFFILTGYTFVWLILNRTQFIDLIIHDLLKNSFEGTLNINGMVLSNEQTQILCP